MIELEVTKQVDFEINIDRVTCSICDNDLETDARLDGAGNVDIWIDPCEHCMQEAVDKALKELEE